MASKARSFEFCGRKIVQWGYRPRRAVKVHRGHFLVALCPSGLVAVDAERIFKHRGDLHPTTQQRLASDLYEVGAITIAEMKHAHQRASEARAAKERRDTVATFESAADELGIALSKRQLAKLARAA